ncbi:hypothetical protein FBALC1_04037 [Flavobacteriales bacterium ALC-1]|nr:hypothetical protein FBALC1_04037 [Flavobacteriales bacterium ALC-1]
MSTATIDKVQEAEEKEIQRIFNLHMQNKQEVRNTTYADRRAKIKKLLKVYLKYRPQIREACYKDFKKHPIEVDLTEIYSVVHEAKHTLNHLHKWMKPQKVSTPLALFGSSSKILYQSKGTVLIISPWNFPFTLTFEPLISAIAAGNTVIIKPSEITSNSASLMKKIIEEVFDEKEVAYFEGGVETSTNLLKLPFNHIFFTGSPGVGKIVMAAAAKNLTSVTLELGGKSPTIIDETANIDMAAKRTSWSKFLNNGQICIAPDHIFVHESKKDEYIASVKKYIKKFFSDDASKESSYGRIVNQMHHQRISKYLEDAIEKGGKIEAGGKLDKTQNYISPTIITNLSEDSDLLQEEIFGPVMPIIAYKDIDEVIEKINSKETPLALYIYSKSKKNINYVLNNTSAGGSCVNHNAIHYFNNNLPFGGSNNSGIGKAKGIFGFQAFSNARGVYQQHIPNALELLLPPYNDFKQKLIDLTIKYF